jgi:hypothetical protein
VNSQRNVPLALAVLVACVAAASIASANSTAVPRVGVHNGVVTVCIEPPTKGNRATFGELNLLVCAKGARRISWNFVRVAREAAADGRADGDYADAPIQPDHGSANA